MEMKMQPGTTYTYVDDLGMRRETSTEEVVSAAAGDELDRKVRQYRNNHPEVSYEGAMDLVLEADEALKIRYVLGE